MNKAQLIEKRKTLLAEVEHADEKRFAEIKAEVEKIDYLLEQIAVNEARAAKETADAELRAARTPNAPVDPTAQKIVVGNNAPVDPTAQTRTDEAAKAIEARAATLRNGGKVELEARAVTSANTALASVVSDQINPAFEQVGSLDGLVGQVHLEGSGAESYKKPFVKGYGEGTIGTEGAAPSGSAEPTFGYAPISKVKIVAYAEITEEVEKLPAANYVAEVEKAVRGAFRKKLIAQIVNGTGTNELVGILHAPVSIIEASQRKNVATIDENTLDNIIFGYGGDEDVEGDAYLVLNKLTLKNFAVVKGSDKKRAYDIVVRGNTGTINGIPFVCTSKLPAFDNATNGNPYMIYGKLSGYELAYFTNIDLEKSKDYKFKEGMIAYRATSYVGGSPAVWNGFITVQKAGASV